MIVRQQVAVATQTFVGSRSENVQTNRKSQDCQLAISVQLFYFHMQNSVRVLTVHIRIQLLLVGRFMYLSVITLFRPKDWILLNCCKVQDRSTAHF
ncbi:MAG: hypothetical protein EZS28_002910 [Streblomastix strix]|uniref:Uncharacterized protein n=1 Tax=Streblomastix strix TaxID=222440 RepID=A0A5J4X4W7_9EUKA|nr:MAG: hypothetical protein EZS28_002910 [Streblomastix strix]